MLRRIILGLGANAFSQVISIAIQLLSLPLFLLYWDTKTYGTWLLLSAVPAYLSIADIGMVATAGNKMTMAVGRSDFVEANKVYQSAQLFMATVCCSLAAIITPLVLFVPAGSLTTNERVALAALMCGVLMGLYGGLSDAVFRATGRYALGTMLGQAIRLAEWSGYIIGLFLFRSFAGVALSGLAARTIGTAVMVYIGQKGAPNLRLGFRHASKAELIGMVRPAISFTVFPLANALTFQGVTLLVGFLSGTAAVAVFNVYRTIARVAVQATAMLSHALWPEFAQLFGRGGMAAVHSLFYRSALLSAAQCVAISLLLYFISPWLLRIWTHGRIEFEPSLMAWLLAYAAVSGIAHVPRILLIATNQHIGLAGWSLVTSVFAVALAWLLGKLWEINGVGAAMMISESFTSAICVILAQRSFADAGGKAGYTL